MMIFEFLSSPSPETKKKWKNVASVKKKIYLCDETTDNNLEKDAVKGKKLKQKQQKK